MATVFLARLSGVAGFNRLYAIKRLHPHLAREPEFVDMFLDEARLAAGIHHPNVVPILEIGTSAQGYYLVMDFIEGDTAARLLARAGSGAARLPAAVGVRIALDTLQGLHAAHNLADDDGKPLHIVHRDVSPQNILVGVDGVARITDFGVAHAASRLSSTATGQLKGKLAYMAPEQARGAAVDRRADVFAMGVVVWELLAGKRLLKGDNDAATLNRILFAELPTLRDAGLDLPAAVDRVIARALVRDPEGRYASAADFGDELERVGRELGLLASTREVATYVDGTIGAEISQQREVVRAWLSRSEPSRNARAGLPYVDPGDKRKSPEATAVEPVGVRTELSSVSAAAVASDASRGRFPAAAEREPAVAAPSHATPWVVGAAVGLAAAAGIALAVYPRVTHRTTAVAAVPAVAVPASPPPAPTVPPAVASTVPAAPPVSTPAAAAEASATPRPVRGLPGTLAPGRIPARPIHVQTRPDDGDDLSRNPYR